jgi:hypothetical protein
VVPDNTPVPVVYLPAPHFTTSPSEAPAPLPPAAARPLSPVAETAETIMALDISPPAISIPVPASGPSTPAPAEPSSSAPAPPADPQPAPTTPPGAASGSALLTQEPFTNPSISSSLRTPSLDSDAGVAMAESVNCLQELFPAASEPLVVQALELHNWDVASASAFLAAVFRTDATLGALSQAFPSAKPQELVDSLRTHHGDLVATFTSLSSQFDSPWGSMGRAYTATCLAATSIPDEPASEEFTDRSPAFTHFENNWWTSYANTFRLRLGDKSPSVLFWDPVSAIWIIRRAIAPRFRSYVTDLALRSVDKRAYKKALRTLCALPGYRKIEELIANPDQREAAVSIIRCLADEGLSTPGAAGWLAYQYANSSPPEGLDSTFNLFTLKYKHVWDLRNCALHSWKKHRGSLSPSKIPIIDLTDSKMGSPSPPVVIPSRAAVTKATESQLKSLEAAASRLRRASASGKSLSHRSLEEAAWGSVCRPQDKAYYDARATRLASKEALLKRSDAQKTKKQKGKGNTD